MKTFDVGPGLSCDIDRLVASRLLIQANSGGGKTRTLRRLLEQTHGKVQHLIIDPEGEYHTLRERFDYVLAAPKGGDTVAHPRTAGLLAERLLQLGVSAILDIYELDPDARQRFVKVFLQALVDAPRELWHPVLIVLDEAHVFSPEGRESESTAAVKALASRGRKRGFCLVAATQRLAKLAKDVAAECNNKLIGRCTLDVDIKRAAEELGFTSAEQKYSLRQLQPGQFFAYGPAFDVAEPHLVKVGAILTTHPEPGQHAAPVPPPTDKVRKILQQLADLPAEAEAREKSIADLRAENATLKRQLAAKPAPAPPLKAERVEVPVLTDKQLEAVTAVVAKADAVIHRSAEALVKPFEQLREQLAALTKAVVSVRQPALPMPPASRATQQRMPSPRPQTAPPVARRAEESGAGLTGPEQRILDAIAWLESIGNTEPEQVAVAFLAGYTYGAGAFNNPRGSLRQKGFVEYLAGNRIRLTDEGRRHVHPPETERLLTTEQLHAAVLARLPGPEQRLLTPLLAAYPDPMTNEDLAAAAGYTPGAGAFNNPKGRLRSLGLIEYPQKGTAVARPLLFLEGR